MDLQFPNGQITYVAGEGVSTSAFLPLCGGLLQAQGQYPGELKFSFSCKVRCMMQGSIWHLMTSVLFSATSSTVLFKINILFLLLYAEWIWNVHYANDAFAWQII